MPLSRAYIARLIAELTGIPLGILFTIYLVTGYQMLYPDKVWFFPRPRALHVDKVLRVLTLILALLHTVAGIIWICEIRIRNRMIRTVIEVITASFLALLYGMLLIVDLLP
jgi:succinate dehydrogenase hydrophobic anchor subunit